MSLNDSILNLALFTVELDYSVYNSMSIGDLQNYLIQYSNRYNSRPTRAGPEQIQDAINILMKLKSDKQQSLSKQKNLSKQQNSNQIESDNFNKGQLDLRRNNIMDLFNMHLTDPFNINSYFTDVYNNIPKENSFVQSYSSTFVNNNGNGFYEEKSMKRSGNEEPVINSKYKKIVNGKFIDDKTKYIQ